MQTVYSFDMVQDTVSVNKKLIYGFSHPFSIKNLMENVGGFSSDNDVFLVLAATLLDREVSFFVLENDHLVQGITEITLSGQSALETADYVFIPNIILEKQIENICQKAKWGTFEDPHTSATVILKTDSHSYVKKVLETLREQNIEYPLGLDLVFVWNNGDFLVVPRLFKEVI